jgi:hypothetical protein
MKSILKTGERGASLWCKEAMLASSLAGRWAMKVKQWED